MNWRWIALMAWRDSRRNRSRLFLFISSIILGIASLVALNTFHINLQQNIDEQAAELLGADLELSSRRKPTDEALQFLDSVGLLSLAMAKEERFVSMIRFPKSDDSQLIQVHGISGAFPFYGRIETTPATAYTDLTRDSTVLVDQRLMAQFSVSVQDSARLGFHAFSVGGAIVSRPGQTSFSGAMTPSVYVSLDHLQHSGLQQAGSRIEYYYYYKFPADIRVDELVGQWKDRLASLQLRSATVETTKERTGRSFEDVGEFMQLVGFVALLLGCIGVSSAVHIYIKEKLVSVAVLRCLGASTRQTFFIFLLQFAAIGLIGGIIGAGLGTVIQYLIPIFLQDVFPVTISYAISWESIIMGVGLGVVIAVLFTLLPLVGVRLVSPLQSLRVSDDSESKPDQWRWWIYLLLLLFILGFTKIQLQDWMRTFAFTGGVLAVFGLLYGTARVFVQLLRKFFPVMWPYLWRQGLSNLYRPNNQTVVLLVAIGFGTALIATLYYVQDMLVRRVEATSAENQVNMILFDIQPSQLEGVKQLASARGFPILEDIPIVTMQIEAINGRGIEDLIRDTADNQSMRAFRGEIRATYRDSLTPAERVTEGRWVSNVASGQIASVSLDEGYAREIGVALQDTLTMNVQGVMIPAVVSSFRAVDWNRFQSNFRMVFARGTIDGAPQFYMVSTETTDESTALAFQQDVVDKFPNVAVIDLNSILSVLEEILGRIGFVIQFIGAFSILTGIVVLISSVRISKYHRIKENVLLRTIGANRKQIFTIVIAEYLFLGILAALTGVVIALVASNLLAILVFQTSFAPPVLFSVVLVLLVALMTVGIGVLNSLSTLNVPPLEAIRKN